MSAVCMALPRDPALFAVDLATDSGTSAVSARPKRERNAEITLRLAERLWNLDDPELARMGDRLYRCATNDLGWRCGITSVCPRCGRRAAVRERLAIQDEHAGVTAERALLTRGVVAPTIAEGHRILNDARRRTMRLIAFRSAFVSGRGRIEATPTADGRWNVHAHEAVVIRDASDLETLETEWASMLAADGHEGRIHIARRRQRPMRTFDGLSYYVSKRRRSELLALDDDQLREWCRTVPSLRWGVRFKTHAPAGAKGQKKTMPRRMPQPNTTTPTSATPKAATMTVLDRQASIGPWRFDEMAQRMTHATIPALSFDTIEMHGVFVGNDNFELARVLFTLAADPRVSAADLGDLMRALAFALEVEEELEEIEDATSEDPPLARLGCSNVYAFGGPNR